MNTTSYTFHVKGMHCNACILMTESELTDLPYVSSAKSSLKHHSVVVTGDFGDKTPEQIATDLTVVLQPKGYSLSVEKQAHDKRWHEFAYALPIAILFAMLFIGLQKLGIVNLVQTSKVGFGTAALIGVVASLSSCMAVVGGLVLSMSATFAKEGDKIRPQLLFHVGRLVSFFVLGGLIGLLGSAFQLSIIGTFVLTLLVALVMLILGINLLDVFHWSKRLQPSVPKFISRHAYGAAKLNHTLTPLLVGIATFFLPCGFTQAMQIYTLSTGSYLTGGLTMLAFALGTLPVLAILSFSSLRISEGKYAGVFFKSAGLIVILFALFNLMNALSVIGIMQPIFSL